MSSYASERMQGNAQSRGGTHVSSHAPSSHPCASDVSLGSVAYDPPVRAWIPPSLQRHLGGPPPSTTTTTTTVGGPSTPSTSQPPVKPRRNKGNWRTNGGKKRAKLKAKERKRAAREGREPDYSYIEAMYPPGGGGGGNAPGGARSARPPPSPSMMGSVGDAGGASIPCASPGCRAFASQRCGLKMCGTCCHHGPHCRIVKRGTCAGDRCPGDANKRCSRGMCGACCSHGPHCRIPGSGGASDGGRWIADGTVVGASAAPLGEENKGMQLLKKMGWSVGTGLGKEGEGAKEAPEIVVKSNKHGLGFSKPLHHQRKSDVSHVGQTYQSSPGGLGFVYATTITSTTDDGEYRDSPTNAPISAAQDAHRHQPKMGRSHRDVGSAKYRSPSYHGDSTHQYHGDSTRHRIGDPHHRHAYAPSHHPHSRQQYHSIAPSRPYRPPHLAH